MEKQAEKEKNATICTEMAQEKMAVFARNTVPADISWKAQKPFFRCQ